jgi:hypothetical protein
LMRDSLAECWIKIDEQPAAPDLLSYIMVWSIDDLEL